MYIHCTHTKYTRVLIWIKYHKWQILSRFLYTSLYDYTILMMACNRVKTPSSNHIVYMQKWFSVGRVFFFHLFNISFHPLHFIIDLMSAFYSKNFWFSLYKLPILVPYNLWCSYTYHHCLAYITYCCHIYVSPIWLSYIRLLYYIL